MVLQQLLEKEYDSDVTNSIIEAKRHLQEFLEDTAYDQERVLLLLQKSISIRILNLNMT